MVSINNIVEDHGLIVLISAFLDDNARNLVNATDPRSHSRLVCRVIATVYTQLSSQRGVSQ